ncbi:uroporphyrinogen-III synthase [Salimicrobium sp. PL1-032A]|uniref:uroporphyrinogen-III synthase n=1 Tax=Salimicrobium sp. PL1-032A TaxID=3095364 RepID=UPI0032609B74
MNSMKGKRIAVAADRRSGELGKLIGNFGGTPVFTPIQGKQQLYEERSINDVKTLIREDFDWVILTTGVGARTLEQAAEKEGLHDSFLDRLNTTRLAVRGQKSVAWLKEHNLTAETVSEDGTMKGVVEMLEPPQKNAFLQAYNVDDAAWKETFEESFDYVYLSRPYEYEKPAEQVKRSLQYEILHSGVQAVLFTSKTQVRNLFEGERDERLAASLNSGTKAVATGKVTAKELEKYGVEKVMYPENQKMGAMVVQLARYFETGNEKEEEKHG